MTPKEFLLLMIPILFALLIHYLPRIGDRLAEYELRHRETNEPSGERGHTKE
jgi:hypothetical protein